MSVIRLDDVMRTERAYGELVARSLERARARAADADVRGVRAVLAEIQMRDEALGFGRPDRVNALVDEIERTRASAERLQLARDRWRAEVDSYRDYRRALRRALDRMGDVESALEDVRLLAGPELERLLAAGDTVETARRHVIGLAPPPALTAVHDLFSQALMLARTAIQLRYTAVQDHDLAAARNAAASAAGGLQLFARGTDQLDRALQLPQLAP